MLILLLQKNLIKIFQKQNQLILLRIFYQKIKCKFIFVSNNFRFGNKREGDVKLLIENEKKYNYKVVKPKPLIVT